MDFKIIAEPNVDSTRTCPYTLEVHIKFSDKKFQKRMTNICKEFGYKIQYEIKEKNIGSFFIPEYIQYPEFKILDKHQLFKNKLIETFIPFPFSLDNMSQGISLVKFWGVFGGYLYVFKTEDFRDRFQKEVTNVLKKFIEENYLEYKTLKEKEV